MVAIYRCGDHTLYACEICGLLYRELEVANKCEEECRKNPGACCVSVIGKAVGRLVRKDGGYEAVIFKQDDKLLYIIKGCLQASP